MTQMGFPDPRIDLVCIRSSCPRQFLQSSTFHVDSGFTSFVARTSNATTIALRCRRAGAVHSIIRTRRNQIVMSAFPPKADINLCQAVFEKTKAKLARGSGKLAHTGGSRMKFLTGGILSA